MKTMSQPRKPFLSITPDVDDAAIEAIAVRKGVRQFLPITPRGGSGAGVEPVAPAVESAPATVSARHDVTEQRATAAAPVIEPSAPEETQIGRTARCNLHYARVGVPDYAMLELRTRSARGEGTVNYILLKALNDYGIVIKPEDLIEDGRRNKDKTA